MKLVSDSISSVFVFNNYEILAVKSAEGVVVNLLNHEWIISDCKPTLGKALDDFVGKYNVAAQRMGWKLMPERE